MQVSGRFSATVGVSLYQACFGEGRLAEKEARERSTAGSGQKEATAPGFYPGFYLGFYLGSAHIAS